ncbi:ABC-2 transporter permease [Miniphocaeibacter halophilus]|uniref:ABC-2 transporter permease n=1 Tax=Miniphocaeibacter halophilus TaxID=2931922 RepID=A0AC61MQ30_9FIRM|nr:ABC-2 transporter permease [Miniphocaeibacter halophilus]QQK07034.1 ABC-2 transporter permease [Miniphocaeibacter halophilus]
MTKLLKYELKESSKYFLYIILGIIIASLSLAFTIIRATKINESNMSEFTAISMGLSSLLAFGLFIAVFVGFIFMIISSYRKDLYTDSAYLKFSLPINGSQLLNAKLLNVLIWSVLMTVVTIVINLLIYGIFLNQYMDEFITSFKNAWDFFNIGIGSNIFLILNYIYSFFASLITVYFCITFTKSFFKNSRNGYIWVLIYIIWGIIKSFISMVTSIALPYYLSLGKNLSIIKLDYGSYADSLLESTEFINLNLGFFIIEIIITVLIYFFTIHMLNKKVDI